MFVFSKVDIFSFEYDPCSFIYKNSWFKLSEFKKMFLFWVQPQPASTAQPPVLTTSAPALVQAPSSQKPSAPAAQDKFTTHALNKNQQTRKVSDSTDERINGKMEERVG